MIRTPLIGFARLSLLVLPLFVALSAISPAPARAEWKLGIEAATDFPLDVGGNLWLELPLRLRVSAGAGVMPGFYVGLVNTAASAAGLYDQDTAQLLQASLTNSLVVRANVGWRPFAERGFYFDVGYGYITLGGGTSTSSAIASISSASPPPTNTSSSTYQVNGKLNMLDVDVGWIWNVTTSVTIRAALGFAFTFASTQNIRPAFTPQDSSADAMFTQSAQQKLDSNSKIYTPTLSLAVGYQIF